MFWQWGVRRLWEGEENVITCAEDVMVEENWHTWPDDEICAEVGPRCSHFWGALGWNWAPGKKWRYTAGSLQLSQKYQNFPDKLCDSLSSDYFGLFCTYTLMYLIVFYSFYNFYLFTLDSFSIYRFYLDVTLTFNVVWTYISKVNDQQRYILSPLIVNLQ